ncbi:hypothetical protein Rhe02_86860 [Rhizocola hellebori]|uniref:GerMN domain-containing protein n=1 Tax=Rhizocola hellebori TaxID=1392758 RepID=A0A8J3QGG5_9ACTN|nr:GerMN domain-containing protein [Rhizocola hellebori]GIH10619.1 hypothetical protein Rhe02_86860 [Rhizocola hellebori]
MRVLVCLALTATLAACTVADPAPTGSSTPSAAVKQPVAVYYALTTPEGLGPRLVREFHRVQEPTDSVVGQVRAAASQMLSHNALDPDYANLWPNGAKLLNVSIAGNTATVDIGGATANNVGAQAAQIAVQQLVWTVTAVPNIDSVKILLDGAPATELWGHVDLSKPLKRASALDTLAPVWLISPQHGDRVGREVTLHIAGIAFEATVHYQVRFGTQVVKEGFVTLDKGAPQQGEAKQTVTLEPGDYVIATFLVSSEDAEKEHLDDHSVTVG